MAAAEPATVVYHLELRAFPHQARAFNLDRETLDRRFLAPYAAGRPIDYDERRWAADRTRLTVLEGPRIERRGLGRGWGEATRQGREVTDAVIAEIHRGAEARPELEALQAAIADAASEPIALTDALALAAAAHPAWKVSEQLSLAEQAVWELLHHHRLELVGVAPERWAEVVLSWAAWTGAAEPPIRLRALSDAN